MPRSQHNMMTEQRPASLDVRVLVPLSGFLRPCPGALLAALQFPDTVRSQKAPVPQRARTVCR